MKTRCYMPTVQQLCCLCDKKLALLREDLAFYQEGKTFRYFSISSINVHKSTIHSKSALYRAFTRIV